MSMPLSTPSHVVASFPDYEQAQYVVDALSDRGLPVQHLVIGSAGLQSFEQITGREGYGRAVAPGASGGAAAGVLLSWRFGLFSLVAPLVSAIVLALWGLLLGAVIGSPARPARPRAVRGAPRLLPGRDRADRHDHLPAEGGVVEQMRRALPTSDLCPPRAALTRGSRRIRVSDQRPTVRVQYCAVRSALTCRAAIPAW